MWAVNGKPFVHEPKITATVHIVTPPNNLPYFLALAKANKSHLPKTLTYAGQTVAITHITPSVVQLCLESECGRLNIKTGQEAIGPQ